MSYRTKAVQCSSGDSQPGTSETMSGDKKEAISALINVARAMREGCGACADGLMQLSTVAYICLGGM